MNGYGSHEFPVNNLPSAGGHTPPWVHVALFGPFALFIAWVLPAGFGVSYTPLLLVAVGSAALGYGAVLIACLSKIVARRRRSDA